MPLPKTAKCCITYKLLILLQHTDWDFLRWLKFTILRKPQVEFTRKQHHSKGWEAKEKGKLPPLKF